MGRLQTIFQRNDRKLLNIYVTAGYPRIDDTIPIIRALEAAGADLVELGMPYSDPLADGQVIQQSSAVALSNGMTISKLLNQLQELRPQTQLPVVLMGYMNPIMQYGFERFCAEAAACGVDGLILPDLPEYEFETYYGPILSKHGLDFIFLITPETSEARVRKLDALHYHRMVLGSEGVSRMSFGQLGDHANVAGSNCWRGLLGLPPHVEELAHALILVVLRVPHMAI